MFSPHTFIALNIEPNEKFLVRHFTARVINVLVVSVLTGCEYPNISIEQIQTNISGRGPGASLEIYSYDAVHTRSRAMRDLWLMPASLCQHLDFGSRNLFLRLANICLPCDNSLYIWAKNSPEKEGVKIGPGQKRSWLVKSNLQPCFPPLKDWRTKFLEFANSFPNCIVLSKFECKIVKFCLNSLY